MLAESEKIEIQTIIYAKGWYKKTDLINDLKVFHGKWAGMLPEHIDSQDLMWYVSMIYTKYVKHKKDLFQFFKEAFQYRSILNAKKSLTMEDIIEDMMSEIHLNIMSVDIPEWPDPDTSILPLKDSESMERWRSIHHLTKV